MKAIGERVAGGVKTKGATLMNVAPFKRGVGLVTIFGDIRCLV